jgi:uncharacterized protein (TIGR03435 family)
MAQPTRFEAVSIRQAAIPLPAGETRTGGQGDPACVERVSADASMIRYSCVSLNTLLIRAFGMRIAGPEWIFAADTPRFDITAGIPKDTSNQQLPTMLRTLLIERFRLGFHRANRDERVLGLVVDRGGPKLKPAPADAQSTPLPCSAPDDGCAARIRNVGGEQVILTPISQHVTSYTSPHIGTALRTVIPGDTLIIHTEAPNTTLTGLAVLATLLPTGQPPIVDMTGIEGRYSIELETPVNAKATNDRLGPLSRAAEAAGRDGTPEGEAWRAALMQTISDTDAVARQALANDLRKLGPRLESRVIPAETIMVDHLEKSPSEN